MAMAVRYAGGLAKVLGSRSGVLAYEAVGAGGDGVTVIFRGRNSFLMAAIPAALAAARLAAGLFDRAGLGPPDEQVPAPALLEALDRSGIELDVIRT